MITNNKIFIFTLIHILIFCVNILSQENPKKLFDLILNVPINYQETIDITNCNNLKNLNGKLENEFKVITKSLQELQPKVQTAMMQNPSIMSNESLINIIQVTGHEYFSDLNDEMIRVQVIINEKRNELINKLDESEQKIDEKYNCGQFATGSPEETNCDNGRKREIHSEDVKIYNEYLKEVKSDLDSYKEKIKKLVVYVNDNINAIPDKSNDAVKFYVFGACQLTNQHIINFIQVIDIHCSHPEFIYNVN